MAVFKNSKQSLRWLFAELAVVVLGILIAFQIEEWRNLRSENEFIKSNLNTVLMELEDENFEFQNALPSLSSQMVSASTLSNELRKMESRIESIIFTNYRGVFSSYTWIPNSSTYDGLRESGRVYLIPNQALIDQLFDYYEFGNYVKTVYEALDSSRDKLRDASLLYRRFFAGEMNPADPFAERLDFELILPLEEIPRNPEMPSILGNHMGAPCVRIVVTL